MKNAADAQPAAGKELMRLPRGKIADRDEPFRLHALHHLAQMRVAMSPERLPFRRGQFIGGAIAPAFFEKGERTIIDDEMLLEKGGCGAEALREEAPKAFTANLIATTGEAGDGAFRMFVPRAFDA